MGPQHSKTACSTKPGVMRLMREGVARSVPRRPSFFFEGSTLCGMGAHFYSPSRLSVVQSSGAACSSARQHLYKAQPEAPTVVPHYPTRGWRLSSCVSPHGSAKLALAWAAGNGCDQDHRQAPSRNTLSGPRQPATGSSSRRPPPSPQSPTEIETRSFQTQKHLSQIVV